MYVTKKQLKSIAEGARQVTINGEKFFGLVRFDATTNISMIKIYHDLQEDIRQERIILALEAERNAIQARCDQIKEIGIASLEEAKEAARLEKRFSEICLKLRSMQGNDIRKVSEDNIEIY